MSTTESSSIFPVSDMSRVLIADDEPTPRSGLCRMIRGMGYEVYAVGDGPAALRYLQQHPGEVRLLLADLFLPGMDGGELAERARDLQPGLLVERLGAPRPGGLRPRASRPVLFSDRARQP